VCIFYNLTIFQFSIPLLIQTYGVFIITYIAAKVIKLPHNIAAPAWPYHHL